MGGPAGGAGGAPSPSGGGQQAGVSGAVTAAGTPGEAASPQSFDPVAFAERRSSQYGGQLDEAFGQAATEMDDDAFWDTRIDSINRMAMELEDDDWEMVAV